MGFTYLRKRQKFVHAGIVYEDVEPSELGQSRLHELSGLGWFTDVRAHRDRFSACRFNSLHHRVRLFSAGCIINGYRSPLARELLRNGCADPFGSAADDSYFSRKLCHKIPTFGVELTFTS